MALSSILLSTTSQSSAQLKTSYNGRRLALIICLVTIACSQKKMEYHVNKTFLYWESHHPCRIPSYRLETTWSYLLPYLIPTWQTLKKRIKSTGKSIKLRDLPDPWWKSHDGSTGLVYLPTFTIHGTGIFTYIYHKNQPNLGKYTIHGYLVEMFEDISWDAFKGSESLVLDMFYPGSPTGHHFLYRLVFGTTILFLQ